MWVDVLYGALFDPTCKIIYDGKRFSSIPFRIDSPAINIAFEGLVYLFIVSDAIIKNLFIEVHISCFHVNQFGCNIYVVLLSTQFVKAFSNKYLL